MSRFCVVALCAVTWFGCSGSTQEQGEIPIGIILPSTGSSSATGTNQLQGATLAVEEINAAGGVLGKKLKILYRDDTSTASAAPALAVELIDAGVPAILGSGPSSITLAIAPLTADAGVVQISGSSTSPAISLFPSGGYLFRTVPADSFQGTLLASRAYTTHGFRNVGVVYVNSAYGTGLAANFKEAFTAAGGTINAGAYVQYTAGQREADYTTLLNGVFAASATKLDAILLVATVGDGTSIFKAYVDNIQSTQPNTFWLFTDSTSVADFVTGVGASAFTASNHEGTKPSSPNNDDFSKFSAAYNTRFGSAPGSFAANAYDAMYLIALGLEKGKSATGSALKDGILGVTATGSAFSATQFSEAISAIKAGTTIDYRGASGACNFAPNATSGTNDLADGIYDIWQVQGGTVTVTVPAVSVK
ncbi:MAG: ABC transporter substrate-binding protein [Archangiaceae bacterium]|nr:ABC transporter substrate-binding protein [Archangiaceae bacterium]